MASGGLENRNPSPKIRGIAFFWDQIGKMKNEQLRKDRQTDSQTDTH